MMGFYELLSKLATRALHATPLVALDVKESQATAPSASNGESTAPTFKTSVEVAPYADLRPQDAPVTGAESILRVCSSLGLDGLSGNGITQLSNLGLWHIESAAI